MVSPALLTSSSAAALNVVLVTFLTTTTVASSHTCLFTGRTNLTDFLCFAVSNAFMLLTCWSHAFRLYATQCLHLAR
ncbi:hypothetical protein V8C86DRAFT_2772865 [Haematococcus lacustris]